MSSAAAQSSSAYTDLLARANANIPAGSFGNLPAEVIIAEGRGARVTDVSGKSYIDYLLGSGPMFLGHAHPEVVAAVQAQVAKGSTFFANSEPGIHLAEAIVDAVPCAEKVRFTSSGTEATHYAMRLARAYRRRDKIMKFEGGFHGMGDWALMSMAPKNPGNFPQATPDSPGIPVSLTNEMLIAPFNDAEAASQMIEANADVLAGVIVEPQQRLIPPKPGFLQALRAVTAKHGIPLIFDEIVTGFRHSYAGAQGYYKVVPDMCALGKIVGGGYPLAAVAGSDEIMKHFDKARVGDEGYVQQTGTLSGNPIAAAAGLATLNALKRPGVYEKAHETGRELVTALKAILAKRGIAANVVGEPVMFEVFFTDRPIHNYRDLMAADAGKLTRFNASLAEQGILKSPVKYYVSAAHGPSEVAETIAAWEKAAKVL